MELPRSLSTEVLSLRILRPRTNREGPAGCLGGRGGFQQYTCTCISKYGLHVQTMCVYYSILHRTILLCIMLCLFDILCHITLHYIHMHYVCIYISSRHKGSQMGPRTSVPSETLCE